MSRPFLLLPLFAVVGCGGDDKPPTVPTTGKVVYRKSATVIPTGALVVFHPVDPAVEKRIGGKPFAKVKDDGTFVLTSYQADDGAPEGEYGVTVQWNKEAKAGKMSLSGEGAGGQQMLNGKYGNPAQPFAKVTVKKGDKNEFAFDVD